MPYVARQDLIDRFGEQEILQLTDKVDPPAGAIDDTVLGRAIADADGVIDAHLVGRYALPLASVPKILVRYACDLTRYFLWEDSASEPVMRAYKAAMAFLEAIAKGTASLGLDAANQPVATDGGSVSFNESRRVFGGDREFG